jgi:hypothetical protein
MPVPSLSTNIQANVSKWTDVQSYFDLECILVTGYDEHLEFLTQSSLSERLHDVWYMCDAGANEKANLVP